MVGLSDIDSFLDWAKEYSKNNNLNLEGFWTYDNDYFSNDYLSRLEREKYLVLNKKRAWYYKDMGRIFENPELPDKFPITYKILKSGREQGYTVLADNYGTYFLVLASLVGNTFNERSFNIDQMYKIRDFIEKERPKGVVLSYITSDTNLGNTDLSALLDLFDIPELKYLKLLFVGNINKKEPEFVVAYSK